MNDIEYGNIIKTELEEQLGLDYEVELKEVIKNNGIRKTGVMIKHSNVDVAPVVYLDEFLNADGDVTKIANNIIECYRSNAFNLDLNIGQSLMSFETIRNEIFAKVINLSANKGMLSNLPHRQILGDLAITYYIHVNLGGVEGIVNVTNDLMDMWSLTEEDLHYISKVNLVSQTKPRVFRLVDFLLDYMDQEDVDFLGSGNEMIVCSLDKTEFGAAVILIDGFLKDLADSFGSDLFIIPSSVYEVIVMEKTNEYSVSDLREMVKSVNETELSETDFLSNDVYLYSRETNSVTVA